MKGIPQRPTPPNDWLHNRALDYTRVFSDFIIRPISTEPWAQCTQAEREKWEEEHKPQPEPEKEQEE